MKKLGLGIAALTALMAAPAFAGGTFINVGFSTPAPVYYAPAPVYYGPPVAYYPPVRRVYFAPPRPCPPRYVYNHYHGHGYQTAWNAPHNNGWHH